jgi:DNA-binding NtrC family response regulator
MLDKGPSHRPFKEAKNELVDDFERRYLDDLLHRFSGNVTAAAREAEIDRVYLHRLLRKHGLGKDDGGEA